MENGHAVAVSDGSFYESTGITTAAWTIKSKDGTVFVMGISTPAFSEQCNGSYRGEVMGLLAITHMTTHLCLKHNISCGKLHIGCNNVKALYTSFSTCKDWHSPKKKHSDLLSSIAGLLELQKVSITFEHIKSHQDDNTDYHHLSRLAQMNVRMDWLAKKAAHLVAEGILSPPSTSFHPCGFTQVYFSNTPIHHRLSDLLYSHVSGNILDNWWITKGKYRLQDIPNIHWESYAKAAASQSKSDQRFAAKWSSGFLATGNNMQKWNFRIGDGCPYCLHPKEDTTHVLHCPHQDSLTVWNEEFSRFIKKLEKLGTEPSLLAALYNDLLSWRMNQTLPHLEFLPASLHTPVQDLRSLTYDTVLEGLLPTSIINYQENFFRQDKSSRKTGTIWAKKVHKSMWALVKALWKGQNEHFHDAQRIEELQGRPHVINLIKAEYNLGLHRLPACEFSMNFSTPVESLITRPLSTLKHWLLTMQLGREFFGGDELVHDMFSSNGPAHTWLGLPPLSDST